MKLTTVGAERSRTCHLVDASDQWLTLCGRRAKRLPPYGKKPEGECDRCKHEAKRLVRGNQGRAQMTTVDPEEYVPTLGEYAAVIEWLWEERHDTTRVDYTGARADHGTPRNQRPGVPTTEMPVWIRVPFNDALERANLRRMARALAEGQGEPDAH